MGDKETKSEGWKVFTNSNKLVFFSIEAQEKLNYKTTQYIPLILTQEKIYGIYMQLNMVPKKFMKQMMITFSKLLINYIINLIFLKFAMLKIIRRL